MTDTARDLIQRLADLADALDGRKRLVSSQGQALDGFTALANFKAIADEARAYLAQPESDGPATPSPTLMEIVALSEEIEEEGLGEVALVRRALDRWGNHPESLDTSNQTSQSPSPMQSLDQHNQQALGMFPLNTQPRPNGIACPECQHELMDSNPSVSLTSWPPQYRVHCPSCGYTGSRY